MGYDCRSGGTYQLGDLPRRHALGDIFPVEESPILIPGNDLKLSEIRDIQFGGTTVLIGRMVRAIFYRITQ